MTVTVSDDEGVTVPRSVPCAEGVPVVVKVAVLLVVFVVDAVSLCEAELVALSLAVFDCVTVLLPVIVALHEVDAEGVTNADGEYVGDLLSLDEPV